MSVQAALQARLRRRYPGVSFSSTSGRFLLRAAADIMPAVALTLTSEYDGEFATLAIEDTGDGGLLAHYFFYLRAEEAEGRGVPIEVVVDVHDNELPAISDRVHAADWHEREAEDMFGIRFEGHPFLGDFVLHDADFPEDVGPMRRSFDPYRTPIGKGQGSGWRPRRTLKEAGALVFPVGPVWGDYHESGLWLLETPGELIRQAHTRLFYKYRGVEKIAEGETADHALLLAERFSGSSAVAHAFACCQAIEKISGCDVPARAGRLRLVFAELERMRYHASTIAELAGSTGLAVAKAMAQEIEEDLLRLSGEVCGHRYLFGLLAPGGLAWAPADAALLRLKEGVAGTVQRFDRLERLFVSSSSFLDRIEEMGVLTPDTAMQYGVSGPVARASGRQLDLRRHLPYGAYGPISFDPPRETEGDGYARLRVFFAEIRTSHRLIHEALEHLPDGPLQASCRPCAGDALAWAEAPSGGAFHWLKLDAGGRVLRWRISTAGFRNWHAFHRAVEGAAFQDFPIILASFGLSIAENDR